MISKVFNRWRCLVRKYCRHMLMTGKRGVALVLVLGLLSMLMLSAVAFSISMRIERNGASNYRNGVIAKHMLWAALAEAITNINANMDNGVSFDIYPKWDIMVSTNIIYMGSGLPKARVLGPSGSNYVSVSTWNLAKSTNAYWYGLYDTNNWQVGRYAFIAVNQSGLLDVNRVGGMTRGSGTNVHEIQISQLPEIGSVPFAEVFTNQRAVHVKYETLGEAYALNEGFQQWPNNMCAFSLSREGEFVVNGIGIQKVDISGDETVLSQPAVKANIIQGLRNSGIDASEAAFVFTNLLDYIDTDCMPKSLVSPCTEAVPMINEFYITNQCTFLDPNVRVRSTLEIETWYPFLKTQTNNFDFHVEWTVTLSNMTVSAIATRTESRAIPSYYVGNPGSPFRVLTAPLETPPIDVSMVAVTGNIINISYEAKAWITAQPGGGTVDIVPYTNYLPIGSFTYVVTNTMVTHPMGMECVDPRFNWQTGPQFWRAYSTPGVHTKGTTNQWTLVWRNQNSGFPYDQGTSMYVSDRGRLNSVGELGNLLLGAANAYKWKTIRLFNRDPSFYVRQTVFENFTLTNGLVNGRVNLNTRNSDVLAAVFTNCPAGYDTNSVIPLSGQVASITNLLIGLNSNVYNDVGEMGVVSNWTACLPGMSDCEREAVLSNTAGLLTTRGNFFTIYLAADAYAEGAGGRTRGKVLASARAVAEIWRDPCRDPSVPGSERVHKCFIRQFKLLDD
ncbi:MAG: hypothetical protein PHI84_15715 [Kiritimatiellae bacterium]|nr:hypothetical protein [Kiritimatiellia bacterium]